MADTIRQETCYRQKGFGTVEFKANVIKCHCGSEVVCDGFTNTCECGRDYNMSGDLLAPRSQWGEDTGESLVDILRI